jgi:hypothetical protein
VTDQFCPKCFARLEPPSLWRKFLSLFKPSSQASDKPRRNLISINKTFDIRISDKDGAKHEYHSLDEVPPEIRAKFEKLQSAALDELDAAMSGAESTQEGSTTKSRFVFKTNISVYKIKDAAGNERTYHSLEEMPPEIRAVFLKPREKTD